MANSLIDQTALREVTEDDPDLLADVSIIFVRLLPGTLASLRHSIESEDAASLRECAHQLKSQLSYFFCDSLVRQTWELEELGKGNRILEATGLANEIFKRINDLILELNELTKLDLKIEEE